MYNPEKECDKIVDAIKTLCSDKNLSQSILAKKAEISPSSLSELMNGKTRPNVYTLFKLCNALEVSFAELIDSRSGDKSPVLSVEEQDLIFIYRSFDASQKKQLRFVMELMDLYKEKLSLYDI
ncbi:MAG: helix-turn-helix domain-containing protein [Rikenellaceae bacterium]|nr:helix-turn-helix domain-containing protein [Rikenellaceae bacterium]